MSRKRCTGVPGTGAKGNRPVGGWKSQPQKHHWGDLWHDRGSHRHLWAKARFFRRLPKPGRNRGPFYLKGPRLPLLQKSRRRGCHPIRFFAASPGWHLSGQSRITDPGRPRARREKERIRNSPGASHTTLPDLGCMMTQAGHRRQTTAAFDPAKKSARNSRKPPFNFPDFRVPRHRQVPDPCGHRRQNTPTLPAIAITASSASSGPMMPTTTISR